MSPRFQTPSRSRASRLVGAAVAAATFASIVSVPAAEAQSSSSAFLSSGSSGSSGSSAPQGPAKELTKVSEGLTVKLIGDLLGRHQHVVGLGAIDLGIMVPLGIGEELGKQFGVIFGDSFTGNGFGRGDWLSPVGVRAVRDENGRIRFIAPLNDGDKVKQLVDYRHDDGLTLIPSDVINVGGTLYMQGMWNRGIGNVLQTEIWTSVDGGARWTSISKSSANHLDGMGNLISWEMGPDGYIYVVSSEFKRNHPVYLSRFREADIASPARWERFNPRTGAWGTAMTPILSDNVRAGEMSLRYIQGHWVLAMFNEQTASIEVRISPTIATDWNAITPAHVVVAGPNGWSGKQNENNFTQLYGGYIVPGSTLDNLDLVVSQWNTSNNSRYMATQFNVKGLDTFFGITPAAPHEVGNQDSVSAVEEPVTPDTEAKLSEERAVEKAADVA